MSTPANGNALNGLFPVLVAASAKSSTVAVSQYNNVMATRVANDFDEEVLGVAGNSVQVNIPVVNMSAVTNIGDGPLNITPTQQNTQLLTIAYNASTSRRLNSFDQLRSPQKLSDLYLSGMIEECLRWIDATLIQIAIGNAATVVAPGITAPSGVNSFLGFNPPYQATSPTAGTFSRLDLNEGWSTIIGQGASLSPANSSFITNQVPFGKMIADTTLNFTQAYVVGTEAAMMAQQTAQFAPFLNSIVDYDQNLASTGSSPTATLAAATTGATPSSFTPPAGKYPGIFFHRGAFVFKPVMQPKTESAVVMEHTIFPRPKLPLRVQVGYDMNQQGWMIHVNCPFAANVIRPEWGQVEYSS